MSTREQLLQWTQDGHLNRTQLKQTLAKLKVEPSLSQWGIFFKQLCLSGGTICFAGSVIFYFAYNWQEMDKAVKFGLCQGAIILSLLIYFNTTNRILIAKAMLLSLSLLTGALLALVGQTYQTGADPWQLFALWSLLIVPWVVMANATGLWLLWVVLVNLTLLTYFDIDQLFDRNLSLTSFTITCAVNSVILVLLEWTRQASSGHVVTTNSHYARCLVLCIAIFSIFVPAVEFLFGRDGAGYAVAIYLGLLGSLFWFYRYRQFELFALTMIIFGAIAFIVTLEIRLLTESLDLSILLLVAMTIVGLASVATYWLRVTAAQITINGGSND